jgi:hypothetical protein
MLKISFYETWYVLSKFGVTYKLGFGLDVLHLIHSHNSGLQAITVLSLFYTLGSSPLRTYTLAFSVFTSHILTVDLSQSHCHFNSHMKSWHSLIHFLPYIFTHLSLPSPELDQILILASWDHRYIASGRTSLKTPSSNVKEYAYSFIA